MTKAEMAAEIKRLRQQMARVEQKAQEREDRLIRLLELLEPFIGAMTKAQADAIIEKAEAEL